MAANARFLINCNFKRCVCSSATNRGKYGSREGRFMKKLLSGDGGKRTWHPDKPRTTGTPGLTEKLTSSHVTRRMSVLNKLFMGHITDLMATGGSYAQLVGRRIEITHVKITPDFRLVLVYWGSKKIDGELETERLLNDCAYGLRHELTQLRVIGQVPMIKFVRNKRITGLVELDKRLGVADYGDDFEPTVMRVAAKPELTLAAKLSPEIKEKILKLEESIDEEDYDDSRYDVYLPPMRHDVLGLDHRAIMNRVQVSLMKVRKGAQNRISNMTTILPPETLIPFDPGSLQSAETSKAFTDFLLKRQIEEKRQLRREKKDISLQYNLENNYVEEDPDDSLPDDEKDVDGFEDVSLESIK